LTVNNLKKIAIIVNVIPTYREGFYKRILNNKNYKIQIFAQKDLPKPIETINYKFKKNVTFVSYFSINEEQIVLSKLPFLKIIKNFDIFMIEGNPRYISHFFLATLLLILKKKVILWTMVHSANNNKITEKIRLYWTKFFKFLFVYTDREKLILKKIGFSKNVIYPMNNGLDQDRIDSIKKKIGNSKIRIKKNHKLFLSCARLLKKNKFEQAIKAFAEIKKTNNNFTWILIGDGEQKKELQELVLKFQLDKNVRFLGSIYSEARLAPYFLSADCLIHPAAIGLSLNQAFGYGLPVITHSNIQFHNPEIAAFKNNFNGLSFKMNDIHSLANVIRKFFKKEKTKNKFTKNCYDIVRNKYNSNTMAKNFFKIVNKVEKFN
jgi:glycosyltransferase involved in cell wall biosynthesis